MTTKMQIKLCYIHEELGYHLSGEKHDDLPEEAPTENTQKP